MLSAALRTGKSNVMEPHAVQRIYGFNFTAKTVSFDSADGLAAITENLGKSLSIFFSPFMVYRPKCTNN